jgi:uncharacterized membrane protein
MKKFVDSIRDTFIAGLIFLLPLLILCALLSKVFMFFKGFTTKLAGLFGMKSILGVSASTIMGVIALILLCVFCGYLMRIAFFKHFSQWTDNKLRKFIPGYEVYHQMALSKLERKEEMLPYEACAWVKNEDGLQPAFIMETLHDNRLVVFLPSAGNVKEGEIRVMESSNVERRDDYDMRAFKMSITNLGLGFAKVHQNRDKNEG